MSIIVFFVWINMCHIAKFVHCKFFDDKHDKPGKSARQNILQ